MTTKEAIAALIQRYGIDGALSAVADQVEEYAEEHEDTVPESAEKYDKIARAVRRTAKEAREILASK
jgi:hypothetical protein